MTEWSPQQSAAITAAVAWLKEGDSPVFRLFGYAGTGKTTLAREIASNVEGKVLYGAFTGKAASVMRRKGCRGASTIHAMIYSLEDEGKQGVQPTIALNADSDVKDADLVIIDECSMIDEDLGKDLLSFGTKVLVLGDPAQLPPVKGAGFFTAATPDIMLTEVHRQAQDNPIIRLSMQVREGKTLEPGIYGETRIITRADLKPADVLEADQVIVGLNRTRHAYNRRIRTLNGRQGEMPVKGDKLVCLRNDRPLKLFNGGLWTVDKVKYLADRTVKIWIRDADAEDGHAAQRHVKVRQEFFTGGEEAIPWQEKRGTQEFTYGYALTCHKSQGSQWNNIVVFDEGNSFRDDAQRWKYTAITRAAERLTMVI